MRVYTGCPENDSGNQHHFIEHVETNKKVHWHISMLLTIKNCINNPIRCSRRGDENRRYREDGEARAAFNILIVKL